MLQNSWRKVGTTVPKTEIDSAGVWILGTSTGGSWSTDDSGLDNIPTEIVYGRGASDPSGTVVTPGYIVKEGNTPLPFTGAESTLSLADANALQTCPVVLRSPYKLVLTVSSYANPFSATVGQ